MAAATSSGSPGRPIGILCFNIVNFSGALANCCVTISVLIMPGQMALMRMPRVEYSRATDLVSLTIACLLA